MDNKEIRKEKKLLLWSLINSFGVLLYVFVISRILFSAEKIFGKMENLWTPFAFLLLFVISAAIVGILFFGRATYLYLDNRKKEAVKLLFYTIGWLFLATVIILAVCALV